MKTIVSTATECTERTCVGELVAPADATRHVVNGPFHIFSTPSTEWVYECRAWRGTVTIGGVTRTWSPARNFGGAA